MRDAELTRCFPFVPAAARGEGGFAVGGVGACDLSHHLQLNCVISYFLKFHLILYAV